MSKIEYETAKFTGAYASLPASGSLSVGTAELIRSACSVAFSPFGLKVARKSRSLELTWRAAMCAASLQRGVSGWWRSDSYEALDPSEKGAVSFFLGQVQAKIFAERLLRLPIFAHYDAYLFASGVPVAKSRPDFLALSASSLNGATVEAKGRTSNFPTPRQMTAAKAQATARVVPPPFTPAAAYVHVGYFNNDMWSAYLEDPPVVRQFTEVEGDGILASYYSPLVGAISERLGLSGAAAREGGRYRACYFEEVDLTFGVLNDVAELLNVDQITPSVGRRLRAVLNEQGTPPGDSGGPLSVGSDGIMVELGASWAADVAD